MKEVSLYLIAAFYIFAGYYHFKNPKFFLRIIPPYLPWHKMLNYVSGAIEIILGALLLFPEYRSIAAWGIIALLIAVLPANIYHLQSAKPGGKEPIWILWLRLPFQGVLFSGLGGIHSNRTRLCSRQIAPTSEGISRMSV